MTGRLVLVATPIGNLGDLSPRAVSTLAEADVVCCEDTRRTGRLLHHAGVRAKRLLAVHDHNEDERVPQVVALVAGGSTVAVVSDAGTPGLSDPGERLVRAVLDADLAVDVVPGPSAAVSALVVSGQPAGRFVFEGFLPRSGAARVRRITEVAGERRTVVLYEAPHRLARTLADLLAVVGADRTVTVVRELTKLHQEVRRHTLASALAALDDQPARGEYVLVLAGAPEPAGASDEDVLEALAAALAEGLSRRDATAQVAATTGRARGDVYALVLTLPKT